MRRQYYESTPVITQLVLSIGKLLGRIDAANLGAPEIRLRKDNQIKTIHSSLAIEGNTLSLDQVTTLFNEKRVSGPAKDILEVKNAIRTYARLRAFDPYDQQHYLDAHRLLMEGLVEQAGSYRTKGVGIFKGDQVAHMAPPAWNVHHTMTNLFDYLKNDPDPLLIRACVFHYEMEFIHPFMDGNGRMGRLWQTVILMQEHPVFELLPIETFIQSNQQEYYNTLAISDKSGVCTTFIEFMLRMIETALAEIETAVRIPLNASTRMQAFLTQLSTEQFTRKDYLAYFRTLSTTTASRDLQRAVEAGLLERIGDKRTARYRQP